MHPLLLGMPAMSQRVGVAPATVWRWVKAGKIPGTQVGTLWRFWAPTAVLAAVGPHAVDRIPQLPPGHVEPGVVPAAQLAELLGIDERTTLDLLARGLLPGLGAGTASWPTIRDRIATGQSLADDPP